ncbi:hypothetical protein SmJEL517_g02826 [Synchytrium microbalum]|uniref:Transmembrane protein n=1 Tax=Synchytrium microbalum TaxID=1806994 RepID=A0A507C906_9FUNG|nr:uncharacterized protein SmJEL517_g02826 [Synchytrium microbalum]TPX34476.1 hypothetical protein SmJEL517_g02826 [Synchytrium microbalum]
MNPNTGNAHFDGLNSNDRRTSSGLRRESSPAQTSRRGSIAQDLKKNLSNMIFANGAIDDDANDDADESGGNVRWNKQDENARSMERNQNARSMERNPISRIAIEVDDGNNNINRINESDERSIPSSMAEIVPTNFAKEFGKNFASRGSSRSSFNTRNGNARELSETLVLKLMEMKFLILAIALNLLLLWVAVNMGTGLVLPIGYDLMGTIGPVVVEISLLLTNVLTITAMNDAAAAYYGYLFISKAGYSLAVCGFAQAGAVSKWSFCNNLSLSSKCRKFLSRLSLLFALAEALKLTTVIAATSLVLEVIRQDDGLVDCITFEQIPGDQSDRTYPTVDYTQGLAELVFGSGLGVLRSEVGGVNITTSVVSPQMLGNVASGETMVGDGFATNISTSCDCFAASPTGFALSGMTAGSITSAYAQYSNMSTNRITGLVSLVENTTTAVTVTSVFSPGWHLCGGATDNQYAEICVTTLSDHTMATVVVEFMTDGYTASVATRAVSIRELGEPADINWVAQAMKAILGGTLTSLNFRPTIPGALSPLLWWTSSDLMSLDANLLEAGMETLFVMFLRAGIQRTYNSHGNSCPLNKGVVDKVRVRMQPQGVDIAIALFAIQLFLLIICIVAFLPWLLSNVPIGPGVRFVREEAYFTTLLTKSPHLTADMVNFGNSPTYSLWQSLDLVARIGEGISTLEAEIGTIVIDRPKHVRALKNGRRFN